MEGPEAHWLQGVMPSAGLNSAFVPFSAGPLGVKHLFVKLFSRILRMSTNRRWLIGRHRKNENGRRV